jgi:NAD(P)-dependent dehydrogenase (short-subunit alcohol dehydrogenase family)
MSRVVLISGGASGIGAALATAHVMAGDTVVVADLNPRDPSHVLLDVRDREAFARVARDVAEQHGQIDLFYDNAGIAVAGGIEELTPAHWDSAIDVNLRGMVHGVEAVYPIMRAQGHGHIVITASLAGLIPVPLLGPYTVTKHAVVALARVLRLEAAASGVKVTAVCPAFVDTPLLQNINPGSPPTGANRVGVALVRRVQGRPISPEQVATIVLAALPRNPEIIVAPRVLGRLGALAERVLPGVVRRLSAYEVSRYRRLDPGRR